MIHDREGAAIQRIADRPACIIQFLPGISLTHPTPRQCEAAGAALGTMHRALEHYAGARANSMGHRHWREIGRAHVCTPVTNAHLVCRLLLDKKKPNNTYH